MRIVGIVLIVISCAGLGMVKGNEMGQRLKLLKEWQRLILLLQQEISCHTTLSDAFINVSKRALPPFQEFLMHLSERLTLYEGKSFCQLFSEEVNMTMKESSLSREDIEQMKTLGEMMEGADRAMQKKILERYGKELEITIGELRVQLPSKQKLYRSLGILGGVFLGILLL